MNPADYSRRLAIGSALLILLLALSGWQPYDRLTWLMEVAPVLVLLPVLWLSRRSLPLTPLLLVLIWIHALILIGGGAYSYARMPLGNWFAEIFHLSRNPYDKLGHFFQGLVPALAAREILIRKQQVRSPGMLNFLVVCIALAVSASYEMIEWLAALLLGQGASEFLGTQGDIWDTQSDMFCALLGSLVTVFLLRRWQDRQLG